MFNKILVPVDPSEVAFAARALETAAGLAAQSKGTVRVVAVMPIVGGYVTEFLPADFDVQAERQAEDAIRKAVAAGGLDAGRTELSIRTGSVYHEVVDEASEWGADLIVVTSHRPSMSTYLIGSNAAKIVRHAPCSVMVVRE
ncbi:universal stress protein [Prosthecomicrobium sp. N25]|uniref:universal stress protein n=1 Tax=Prosthecomicrobium sp. N25 TaxID=3129254 RepID=UPI00307759AB